MTDPHKKYFDELVIALRMRDVPGDEIGAALEEARDHIAHSGESPEETFGTAADYARDLAEAGGRSSHARVGLNGGEALLGLAMFIAGFLFLRSLSATFANLGRLELTAGMVVGVPLILLLGAFVVWPLILKHASGGIGLWAPVLAIIVMLLGVARATLWVDGYYFWLGPPTLNVPTWAGMMVSVLIGTGALLWLRRRHDPVRRP